MNKILHKTRNRFSIVSACFDIYQNYQIPYDDTVEMTNEFKGLDLIDRGPEKEWMEVHNIVEEVVIKTISKKKKRKKAKWLSEEAYQTAEKIQMKGKG